MALEYTTKPPASVKFTVPPPHIATIVEKTADFISRNGPTVEQKILTKEANNSNFDFLKEDSPFHQYYKHMLHQFVTKNAIEKAGLPAAAPITAAKLLKSSTTTVEKKAELRLRPKQPPPPFRYAFDLPNQITNGELEQMKLVAYYTAKYGKQFLNQLSIREERNPSYEFLKKTSTRYYFFMTLIDEYMKCLYPTNDMRRKVEYDVSDIRNVRARIRQRVEYELYQEALRRREEEQERIIQQRKNDAQEIDWKSFAVVEVVDFRNSDFGLEDDVGPAGAPTGAAAAVAAAAAAASAIVAPTPTLVVPEREGVTIAAPTGAGLFKFGGAGDTDEEMMDVDMDMEDEAPAPSAVSAPSISAPASSSSPSSASSSSLSSSSSSASALSSSSSSITAPSPASLAYRMQLQQHQQHRMVRCTFCNQLFSEDEIDEHLKFEMHDKRGRRERMMAIEKSKTTLLAEDEEVLISLQKMSRKREDIFGTAEEREKEREIVENREREKAQEEEREAERERRKQQREAEDEHERLVSAQRDLAAWDGRANTVKMVKGFAEQVPQIDYAKRKEVGPALSTEEDASSAKKRPRPKKSGNDDDDNDDDEESSKPKKKKKKGE